ncbi:hypothetical protein PG994_002240 [Apiospora phragmitis]|uniref:Uncharacterized protein n=1 Tax=Apiospora phragmitis TaxID=2905665 RepID=A0ABR1WVT6_9PEZI
MSQHPELWVVQISNEELDTIIVTVGKQAQAEPGGGSVFTTDHVNYKKVFKSMRYGLEAEDLV